MTKWEYFFYSVKNIELNQQINPETSPLLIVPQLGEEGWELITMCVYQNNTLLVFKRPKE